MRFARRSFLVFGALCSAAPITLAQTSTPAGPRLHHVGLNTVDPEKAIAWYLKVWPSATRTTVAGYPAVQSRHARAVQQSGSPAGRRVARRSPSRRGAERVLAHRREHQHDRHQGATELGRRVSPAAVHRAEGYDARRCGAPGWRRTPERRAPRNSRTPQPRRRATVDSATSSRPTACCSSSPAARTTRDSFSHIHFYHEQPLCAANWYVEHLGMELPPVRDSSGKETPRAPWDPCDVQYGEAGWPSLEPIGTIRQPSGQRAVRQRHDVVVSAPVRQRSVRPRSQARAVARPGARSRRVSRRRISMRSTRNCGATA